MPRSHRFRNNSYFSSSFINETWEKLQVLFQHYFQVRADGHSIPVLLEAILQLLPLDTYVYAPVCCFLSLWQDHCWLDRCRWCWWILWIRTRIRGCQSPQCGQHIRACWIPLKAKRCDFSSTTILLHKLYDTQVEVTRLERFEFYKQAKEAYAVVHTGETALYGNIILQKGVLRTWFIVTISGHKVTGI